MTLDSFKIMEAIETIHSEGRYQWSHHGFHLISGGYWKAKITVLNGRKIYFTIEYGVKSDVEDRTYRLHYVMNTRTLAYKEA